MSDDKQRTITCPRCNYDRAEIHNIVMADVGVKVGETIKCPKCQKKEEKDVG